MTMTIRTGRAICALILALMSGACASRGERAAPQTASAPVEEEKRDDTMDRAGDIATQPVRDIGISKKEIPEVLVKAADDPYAPPPSRRCVGLRTQYAALNDALGPDFSADTEKNENRAGKIAAAGGEMLVNSLIPFRGLVREISGAASADRKLAAAIQAGLARRGYLRGLATARRCRLDSSPHMRP